MSTLPTLSFGVEFTLTMGCQHNCWYCPQENLMKSYYKNDKNRQKHLSFEQFKVCLSKVRRGTGITIGGMSEPFQNPECAKIIKYDYDNGYLITLLTTLQGMNEEDFELLKDVQYESFVVHVPDEEGRAKFIIDDEYLKILKKNIESQKIDYFSCQGTTHSSVKNLIKNNMKVANQMLDRAGNLTYEEFKPVHTDGKIDCFCGTELGTVGWFPMVLADGTMLHCQMDYSMEHVIGNLLHDDWTTIITNVDYLYTERAKDNDKMELICRRCSQCRKRIDTKKHYNFLSGSRAIKVARALEQYMRGALTEYPYTEVNSEGKRIIKELNSVDDICIYGMGSLFWKNFFPRSWDAALEPTLLCDKNEKYWGKTFGGISCISPQELSEKKDVLIIICIVDDVDVKTYLHSLGMKKVINIFDIYNMFDGE